MAGTGKRNEEQVAKVVARQLEMRKMVRALVQNGTSKHEAARMSGCSYDQTLLWTRDMVTECPLPTGKGREEAYDEYEPRPAVSATDTSVGSPERIEVYAARVAAGQHWSHPWDSRHCERIDGRYERQ